MSVQFSAGAEEMVAERGSSRPSLGRYGQAGKQGSCLLAALSRHVLQALCVEPVEVQPERQKPQKFQQPTGSTPPKRGTQQAECATKGPQELGAASAAAHVFINALTGSKGIQKYINPFIGSDEF